MAKIIAIHSFRGGTGKSNTAANIAALLAAQGWRVGVFDTDIQSPGIHAIFGLTDDDLVFTLNNYLWGECDIDEATYDVTDRLGAHIPGKVFLIPASLDMSEMKRLMREGYDVSLLNEGFLRALVTLDLDMLVLDTHPGLNDETLLSIAVANTLLLILRPDQQDYQGTSIVVTVAQKLEVPRLLLLFNKVPPLFDEQQLRTRAEQVYQNKVVGVLPHSDEMMTLASSGIFVLRYPDHPITAKLRQVAAALLD